MLISSLYELPACLITQIINKIEIKCSLKVLFTEENILRNLILLMKLTQYF